MRLAWLSLFALVGCGGVRVPEARDEAFSFAVEQQKSGNDEAAASAAWEYFRGSTVDDPRYDRALRLLARSAERLGLSYAASLWYLEIAQARRAPELVPEAVRGIKRIIEAGGYDEDLLLTGFIAASEVADLPVELQAFVDYHRGLLAARQAHDDWADARLASVSSNSPYRGRADYVQSVRQVARHDLEAAREALVKLAAQEALPADLATDVQRSLARLSMSAGDADGALEHYEALRALSPRDPELLLEMAWAHFKIGDARRALGLLLALDAPTYDSLIAPDRFLLEALSLRRLCQFGPARSAAVRLQRRYNDALTDLYGGVAPIRSASLRAAARRRPTLAVVSEFARTVEAERATLDDLNVTPELTLQLAEVYRRGARESARQLDAALVVEVDALARELLAAEEGVQLILHDLGVALLRGRRRPDGPAEKPAPEYGVGSGKVLFRFDGEFWSDELDDLVVVAEDRCID